MLVPVNDAQVVTKQTMASDADFSVRRDGRAIIDEGVIADRNARCRMRHDLDRHDGAYQANTFSEFHITASPKLNAAIETYRKGNGGLPAHSHLSIEDGRGKMRIANYFEDLANGTHWIAPTNSHHDIGLTADRCVVRSSSTAPHFNGDDLHRSRRKPCRSTVGRRAGARHVRERGAP
jgi:mannose-6-phosphate isomerase-like protein (cupin superfamily)